MKKMMLSVVTVTLLATSAFANEHEKKDANSTSMETNANLTHKKKTKQHKKDATSESTQSTEQAPKK